MLGIRTIDEARKIPESNAFACANMIIEDGLIKTRDGFNKLNSTKYGAAINGIYDYKGRTGVHTAIIGSNGNVYSFGYYSIEVPATIYSGINFTIVVTKFNFFGNRDYSYNGTCVFTEDGGGSLGTANVACVQGKATLTTQKYTGANATIKITGTDSVDSFVFGSDTTSVITRPFNDVAQDDPVTASSENGSFPKENVNNGNNYVSWIATSAVAGEWIRIDLTTNYLISQFKIGSAGYPGPPTAFKLQYSLNDVAWFDAFTGTNADIGWPGLPGSATGFTAQTGRYWRFWGLTTAQATFELSVIQLSL